MSKWYNYDPRDGTGLVQREQGNPAPVEGNNNKNKNKKPDNTRRLPPLDIRITAEPILHIRKIQSIPHITPHKMN
jgi:hypothetical protein